MSVKVESIFSVEGSLSEIETFIIENSNEEIGLSFSQSFPIPAELSDEEWLKWSFSNWGSPVNPLATSNWLMSSYGYQNGYGEAKITITTHWATPTVYLFNISQKYPELTFSLAQPDHDTVTDYIVVREGKPVDDYETEYAMSMGYDEEWDYQTPAYMGRNPEEYKRNLDREYCECDSCMEAQEQYWLEVNPPVDGTGSSTPTYVYNKNPLDMEPPF